MAGSFGLSSNSRNRRMLIVRQSMAAEPSADAASVESSDEVGAADTVDSQAIISLEESRHALPIADAVSHPRAGGIAALRELLARDEPRVWVFAGDRITIGGDSWRAGRSYPEIIAAQLRSGGRPADIAITSGLAGLTVAALLERFHEMVGRFQPQIASVLLSFSDAEQGPSHREEFERDLGKVIERILDLGSTPLLQTPHWIDVTQSPPLADLRAYIRAIRETAQKYDVACVDHWSYWKRAQFAVPDPDAWLADDKLHPGVYGQRMLAELVLKNLKLNKKVRTAE